MDKSIQTIRRCALKKLILLSFALNLTLAFPFFAQAGDLTLPGERWLATFDKYVCAAFGESVTRPQALERLNATFEQLTTDSTLDNVLLKATFEENGKTCRYNAILFADNAAQAYTLVQSIAYDPAGGGSSYRDCGAGKAVLDGALSGHKYLYYGHPHNVALMMTGVGAEAVCGSGAPVIGANFVVKGIVKP